MKTRIFFLILVLLVGGKSIAQNDSIDVIHYDLTIDVDHLTPQLLIGTANISVQRLLPCNQITFDLLAATIDSIKVNSASTNYQHHDNMVFIPMNNSETMKTDTISIYYHTPGFVESGYAWGGFHMDNNIHYNLGVSFGLTPHNFGRAWFPCRDNFYDKATYNLQVTTQQGWRSSCSGIRTSETINADGSNTSTWQLNLPTPTYLFSVAMGPFHIIERNFQGLTTTYPAMISFIEQDSIEVERAFDIMDSVIPYFEHRFGPYRWERIGYVATPQGSMEHICNIALVSRCMSSQATMCQSVRIHEFAHSWFGNLVTCATDKDMWINEGGATFCEEVGFEKAFNRQFSDNYYTKKLESVLRTNHHNENGFLALHGITNPHVYGSTTYDKGAMVWHSLRGYMGEETFYNAMKRLFTNHAFGNVSAQQLRDSLMLYSGQDLTHFFNFHVFNPGFVDYVIDSIWTLNNQTHITIHQQLLGTTQYSDGNRIPVTFFSYDRKQTSKQLITFNGVSTTATFTLPFTPSYAILDYNKEISDAVTDEEVLIAPSQKETLDLTHIKVNNNAQDSCYLHVAHHWTAPISQPQQGIIRTADRFWEINTSAKAHPDIKTQFYYSLGSNKTNAQYLDNEFYTNPQSIDSMGILYRPYTHAPWQLISRKHSKNTSYGFFTVMGLQSGQYTLAIVDTNLVSIQQPQFPTSFIYPNPSNGQFNVNAPNNNCTLYISNLVGQIVEQISHVGNSVSLQSLTTGTYIAQLKHHNGKIIATQKIIIQ